ncbi:hypothetical protein CDCA_CDCA20G4839 [Cyanidium caldarium]|uniref:P-type domain-containing protein n=1 Tax=Cyanidium caldarium TaxID=2771 RepID=A0AAV9J2V1_CYACA|nr:hypothetical protein CDCA_CDCA20G4839 [Cyanidium caldarium]
MSRARVIYLLTAAASLLLALWAVAGGASALPAPRARTYSDSQGTVFQQQSQQQTQQPQEQQQQVVYSDLQQQSYATYTPSAQCSSEECGTHLNQQQCYEFGCCWDGHLCLLPTPAPSCDVAVQDRSACGWPGITPQECTSYGCCWLPPPAGEYGAFCFYKPGEEPAYKPDYPQTVCNVTVHLQCAAVSNQQQVSESQCVAHGCCFDPTYYYTSNGQQQQQQSGFCYEPLGTCYVEASQRQNCGYPGINAQQCYERGCCFEPIYPYEGSDNQALSRIPWCYYKQPQYVCSNSSDTVCGQECCDSSQTCVLQVREAQQQAEQAKQQNQQYWQSVQPTTLPSNTNCACKEGYTNCGKLSTPLWYGFERLLCCPPGTSCGDGQCV